MKIMQRFTAGFLVVIMLLLVSGGDVVNLADAAVASDYHSAWSSQSDYLSLAPGETGTIWIKFKNTGTSTWYNTGSNPVDLGTSGPLDRSSSFYSNSWLAVNRPATMSEASVAPGATGTFTFEVTAPLTVGTYNEYFRPVVENLTWMEDNGVFIEITVTNSGSGGYSCQFVSQSPDLTLAPGETAEVWVRFMNNGTSTWYKNGEHPMHLATSSLRDRSSLFNNSSWLSANRPTDMDQASVAPGGYATFTFTVKAPSFQKSYTENFSLVAEGLTWLNDTGLNWQFVVDNDANEEEDIADDFDLTAGSGDDGVDLDWDEYDDDFDSYAVLRSTSDSTPEYSGQYYASAGDDNEYTDNGAVDGGHYYYRVAVINNGDVVAYSEVVYMTYFDDDDFDLTAESGDDGVELEWNPYEDDDFDYYVILRSATDSTPDYSKDYYDYVDNDETSYLDWDADDGEGYYYRVGALWNNDVIIYSDAVYITYNIDDNYGEYEIESYGDFDLTAYGDGNGIDLQWDEYDDEDVDYYVILRSTSDSTPDYSKDYYDRAEDDEYDYTDDDVENDTYYYRIAAYDGGVVAYSDAISIRYSDGGGSFSLNGYSSDHEIELIWDEYDDQNFDYYVILRSTSDSTPNYPGEYYTHLDSDDTDYIDTDVASGQTYYYRIGIYDNGNILEYSDTLTMNFV